MIKSGLTVNLVVTKVLFAAVVVANVIGTVLGVRAPFITTCVVAVWFKALLSSLGYVKKLAADEKDEKIYEISIPTVSIGLLRFVQIVYALWRGSNQWPLFLITIVIDIAYLVFLYLDSAMYCFVTTECKEEEL